MTAAPRLYLITWTRYGGWGWVLTTSDKVLGSGRVMLTVDDPLVFCYCTIQGHA